MVQNGFKIFGKFSGVFRNFRKTSETVQKRFSDDFMILKIFEKSSGIFGSVRNFLESFGNGSKVFFRCFYYFLKFSENLQVLENHRKISGRDRKCS